MSERPSKYHARKASCAVCAATHDSQRERQRCWELAHRERLGEIHDLERQVRYRLAVNGRHVCTYICDYRYRMADGTLVVEDVKGYRTREYVIKRNLMLAIYNIAIRET